MRAPMHPETSQRRRSDAAAAAALLAPAVVGFALFYAFPTIKGVWYSVTNATLLVPGSFVGLQNYATVMGDQRFWGSVGVTVQYAVINVASELLLGLALALVLARLTSSLWVRSVVLLPWLVPGVAAGVLWLWILDPTLGVANQALGLVGIPAQSFLSSPEQAMPTIALINTWRFVGYFALLLFAGMQVIPTHLYEAASVDGAGEVRMFFSITLPLLRPVLLLVTVVGVIGSFQVFDLIQVTTKGGPVNSTNALYFFITEKAFSGFDLAYASTAGVLMMMALGALTLIQLRVGRAAESDLGSA